MTVENGAKCTCVAQRTEQNEITVASQLINAHCLRQHLLWVVSHFTASTSEWIRGVVYVTCGSSCSYAPKLTLKMARALKRTIIG